MNLPEIDILVNRLQKGEETAFSEVYDRYSGALNGVILRIVQDEDAAMDVLQDTFVKIWKNCQSYDATKGSFYTWMLNIARNTAIDSLRKLKKSGISENQHWDTNVGGSAGSIQQNTNTIGLLNLVDKLADEQKIIIEYLYFKGYTQQEVSDELELPLGTVKTRTRMAMRELRKWFTLFLLWM